MKATAGRSNRRWLLLEWRMLAQIEADLKTPKSSTSKSRRKNFTLAG
jgi:hypothetical protein